jgi:hypothetical protein
MDINGLTTIKSIADDVILELGIDESYKLNMIRFAERGITEFSGLHLEDTKTVLLQIDPDSLTSPLPMDYMMFSRIGVFYKNQIIQLSSNSRLKYDRQIECGGSDTDKETFDGSLYLGQGKHGQYGFRGGKSEYGDYIIDTKNWNIQFSTYADNIVLEYVSTGIEKNGQTYVLEGMREALIAWCKWKWAEGNNQKMLGYYEGQYYNEVKKFRRKYIRLSLQEYKDAIFESLSNTVTR